ncbi:ABC transporter substrate-binding protein [Mesorhizobium sp. BAC0120]|uniref:ABC transporter substrate-binding protein n=1 Tax=Mesorhizobium sp. BAC0120 TaxID=3090670 RepID=UPI00298D2886|nr:ABC transporter substrate-binding protein [Mesorhizobium sp. BAC0120]MDW6025613.1 ABC transporter substrate-binding protein [Mesorhizobium sp. BAC0120]
MNITRRTALAMLGSTLLPVAVRADDREPPFLKPLIESGKLPALAQRLPLNPRVVNLSAMGRKTGRYGGDIRSLISGQRDIRLMTINGYARLVGFDEKLNFQPDILENFETVEDRVYTLKIRDGHKWSDGEPFTSEDFRYMWEDVLAHEDLSPGGYGPALTVDDKPAVFEVIDKLTVRYSWDSPNPNFLPALAGGQPLYLTLPAHYMKQFHEKYQDADKLKAMVKKSKVKNWASLHMRMARQYRPENPDLPTLDPWLNTTKPPAEQFVFERNPFFHRVDEKGLQLPYVDRWLLNVSSSAIIPAKTGAGESDLQFLGIDFQDYTFLKEAEKRFPIRVNLWKRTQGARIALLPNLNCADDVWRKLLQDVRFRRALSLGIDRQEINKAVFYGLATVSADAVLPDSPLYEPEYQNAWIAHDPDRANALLDEIGLTKRDSDGIRLLPDGRRAQIIVESSGEDTLETDVLELITDHWSDIGLALFVRTSQRDVFRSRAMGGEIMMAIWSGIDNGVPTADMNPEWLAPTHDDQLQWPVWGNNYLTHGEKGSAPTIPEVVELIVLLKKWRKSTTLEERRAVWHRMLALYTDQVFSIGIVNATLQPIVSARRLHNLPDKGLFGFEPTAFLGVYMPDTFWLGEQEES